jgi:hypothetical protein
VSTQRLPPEDPGPDDPPDDPDDPEPPDVRELGDPLIPPPEPLPEDPDVPPVLDELDPPLLVDPEPELPEDPGTPELDEPGFPVSSSGLPLADVALFPELGWPSPCDELPGSRLELLDEPLMPPWLVLDEPEVFWSRSAMILSSKMLWTYVGTEQAAVLRALPSVPHRSAIRRPMCPTHEGARRRHCPV